MASANSPCSVISDSSTGNPPTKARIQRPRHRPNPRAIQALPGSVSVPVGSVPFAIPNFLERAINFMELGPVVHHAPGTYSRDLPGLDCEFELVFSDNSAMWDWGVHDFKGCHDALCVHMSTLPRDAELRRLEFRLADPLSFNDFVQAIDDGVWVGANGYTAPYLNPIAIPCTPLWDRVLPATAYLYPLAACGLGTPPCMDLWRTG